MTHITQASQLSRSEQVSLTSGADIWHMQGIADKDIPEYMITDGPHGLRKAPDGNQMGSLQTAIPATCFPPAAGMASSWNPELARRVGVALGEECIQEKVAVILGPGVNMKRNPRGGRNFEYWSEDPLVAAVQATGLIEGVQSQGIGTSLKHFAANNQETDRLRVSANISQRALREIYLSAFEYIITHAKPWTVMCSYNKINGTYASQNHWLLTDILRGEWGYEGMVMSDWGAVQDRVASLNAGLNLEMPPSHTDETIEREVEMGSITQEQLEAMAQGVLDLINRARPAMEREGYTYSVDDHDALAAQAARESMVLLKNDDAILPLEKGTSVAVIGEFARTPRYQGGGSSHITPTKLTTVLDAFRTAGVAVDFAPGFTLDETEQTESLTREAVEAASKNDVVVLCMGLPETRESEGFDRPDIELPAKQIAVLEEVAAANPNVVVVLSNGAVVSVTGWQQHAKGLIESWLLGQAGGAAVVDVLTGAVCPSGRLAETIPNRLEDVPNFDTFPGGEQSVEYNEGIYVGYRHYDTANVEVAYPFGFGLSYTTFQYEDLRVTPVSDTSVEVTVSVTNTGTREGDEVVQVYVAPQSDSTRIIDRPAHELRSFTKVHLGVGESRKVSFVLDARAFSYWSERLGQWRALGGDYEIQVARSSRDIALSQTVTIVGDGSRLPLTQMSTVQEWLDDPQGSAVLDQLTQGAVQKAIPDDEIARAMMLQMPLQSGVAFGLFPRELLEAALAQVNK